MAFFDSTTSAIFLVKAVVKVLRVQKEVTQSHAPILRVSRLHPKDSMWMKTIAMTISGKCNLRQKPTASVVLKLHCTLESLF